jgi:hypothetical protein
LGVTSVSKSAATNRFLEAFVDVIRRWTFAR